MVCFSHVFPLTWEFHFQRDIIARGATLGDISQVFGGFLVYMGIVGILFCIRFYTARKALLRHREQETNRKNQLQELAADYPLPAVLVSCGAAPEEYNMLTVAWTGTVCSESGVIHLVWGYPAVTAFGGNPGILSAAGLTGIFNPTQAQLEAEGYTYTQGGVIATFGVTGAPDAANCFFTYTQPNQANVAATISGLTIGGC